MFVDMILVGICVLLFFLLNRSYAKNPFTYANILITGLIIMLAAIIMGRSAFAASPDGASPFSVRTAVVLLWDFSRMLFIPICFLCLFVCISNVVLLKKEGFRKNNLIGLLLASVYLFVINITWRPLNEAPGVLSGLLIFLRLMLCYLECTVLSICINGYAVQRISPVYDRDYVIILGCSISKKGKLRPLLKGRVNRAIRFAWDQEIRTGKPVKYVPSGGRGNDEIMSEGSAMEMYLLSHSAEDFEVFPEKRSRNTKENLIYSKEIIDSKKKDAKVTVVTTNYHVLRSGMLAARAGFTGATLTASSTKWYFWPNAFAREMIAIFLMYMPVHAAAVLICAAAAFSVVYI